MPASCARCARSLALYRTCSLVVKFGLLACWLPAKLHDSSIFSLAELCRVCAHGAAVLHRLRTEHRGERQEIANSLIFQYVFAVLVSLHSGTILGSLTADSPMRPFRQ